MNRLQVRCSVFSPTIAMVAVLFFFSSAPVFSSVMTKDSIERYFSAVKKDFDRMAENPIMKRPAAKPVNGLFVVMLKRHQPFYSLMRTNAKGVMINEVVRGQMPEKVKKNIREQEWFKRISKTATEYYGFTFIEENGRYYLFWVDPVIGPKKKFAGAVVSKIDLWDCFHAMSKETTEPFLVRLGGKSLFSDKWKNTPNTIDVPLEISGVEKISLLTEKPAIAPDTTLTAPRKDTGAVAAVAPALLSNKPEPKAKSAGGVFAKYKLLFIFGGIVVLIIIVFLFIRFYSWLSNVFTMRSINKPDEDPFGRR